MFAHGKQVRVHVGHLDSPANSAAPGSVASIPGSGDNKAYDVSAYLREASIANPVDTADTSAFGSSAKTFVIGQYNSTLTTRGMFEDTASTGLDAIVNPMIGVECPQALAVYPTGYTDPTKAATYAKRAWAGLGFVTAYDISGSVGDMVSAGLTLQGTGNVRSGPLLTDPRTGFGGSPDTYFTWGGTTADDGYDFGASWNTTAKPTYIFLFLTANDRDDGSIDVRYVESSTQGSGYAVNSAIPAFSSVAFGATSCQVIEVPAGTTMLRYGSVQAVITDGSTGAYYMSVIVARQG